MDRGYRIKLDLDFPCNNSNMEFMQNDTNVNDFYVTLTEGNEIIDLSLATVIIAVLKPSLNSQAQFVEVVNNGICVNLNPQMCDEIGVYKARLMIIIGDEKITTDVFSYEIKENAIINLVNEVASTTQEFTLLTDMLSRLSTIENAEIQRVTNEQARQVLKGQVDVLKTDLESLQVTLNSLDDNVSANEETRQSNESTRQNLKTSMETLKTNLETLQTSLSSLESNVETNEQARQSLKAQMETLKGEIETLRVTLNSNESTRQSNEEARQLLKGQMDALKSNLESLKTNLETLNDEVANNENTRVEQEEYRQTLKAQMESLKNSLEALENTVTNNESTRGVAFTDKLNEVNTKVTEINNKIVEANTTLSSVNIAKNDTITATTNATNKITEVEATRQSIIATINNIQATFNALAPANSTNAEVQLARTDITGKTFASLQERLISDSKGTNITYSSVEGAYNTIADSVEAKVQNIEILGNTYQDPNNLATIKSVANVLSDNTYKMSILSCAKNMFDGQLIIGSYSTSDGYTPVVTTTNIASVNYLKVKGSVTYVLQVEKSGSTRVFEYGKDKVMIKNYLLDSTLKFTTSVDCKYVRFQANIGVDANINLKCQLEEGTVATTVETPQYNKSEKLLPVQLEKVGTVADRLYFDLTEKAWCIDKAITNKVSSSSSITWIKDNAYSTETYDVFRAYLNAYGFDTKCIVGYTKVASIELLQSTNSECAYLGSSYAYFKVAKGKYSTPTDFSNALIGRFVLLQSQKIILPLSTQIALNSFMGTTHIFSDDTEIEPTIRAKVSKSLGASVESNLNSINVLSDKIANLEGLKDSQEFSYNTSKGYLNCLNTKDASVDNLKLSGRTLNNIVKNGNFASTIGWTSITSTFTTTNNILTATVNSANIAMSIYNDTLFDVATNKKVFIKAQVRTTSTGISNLSINLRGTTSTTDKQVITATQSNPVQNQWYTLYGIATITSDITGKIRIVNYMDGATDINGKVMEVQNVMALDLTSLGMANYTASEVNSMLNGYIEGLKSTGQDVNEIEVLTVKNDGNLVVKDLKQGYISSSTGDFLIGSGNNNVSNDTFARVEPNTKYYFNFEVITGKTLNVRAFRYGINKNYLGNVAIANSITKGEYIMPSDTYFVKFVFDKVSSDCLISDLGKLYFGKQNVSYLDMKYNKKQILYYNTSGQLVAVPELRGIWNNGVLTVGDTVEKHSDIKWYWHKRMFETVLNGSESGWTTGSGTLTNTVSFMIPINNIKTGGYGINTFAKWITYGISVDDSELFMASNGYLYIRILKTRLATQDVTGFKTWLASNNITVAYELQAEEIYEVIDLHLDSYSNETMISLGSGAINPYVEWTVSSYLPNFVKDINQEVQKLSERYYKDYQFIIAMLLNHDSRLTAHGI